MMLNTSLSYKSLLKIIGLCLFVYGIYSVVSALTSQSDVGGSVQYNGPAILWDPGEVLTYIFFGGFLPANPILPHFVLQISYWPYGFLPGPLFVVGLSLLLFGLASSRVHLAYWSLQVAFWLISMSLWVSLANSLSSNGIEIPDSFTPFFWITLLLSLAILALYKPVTHLLRKLYVPDTTVLAPQ